MLYIIVFKHAKGLRCTRTASNHKPLTAGESYRPQVLETYFALQGRMPRCPIFVVLDTIDIEVKAVTVQ